MHVDQMPFRVPAEHPLQAEPGSASVHPPTQITATPEVVSRPIPLTQPTRTTSSGTTSLRRVCCLVPTELLAEVLVRLGMAPRPIRARGTSMVPRSLRLLPLGLGQAMPAGKAWAHPLRLSPMPTRATGRPRIWDRYLPSMEIL